MAIANSIEMHSNEELTKYPSMQCESVDMGKEVEETAKTGTMVAGYTVITKSMIGAGMLSMAYGCADFGIILGVMFLILAGAITWLSLRCLAVLALEFQGTSPSFYSVSEAILPKAKWVLDAALIINCFGGCTAFVQLIGKLMSQGLFDLIHWNTKEFSQESASMVIQVCVLALLAPLCMMKEISSTKIANMVGLGCIAYIFVMTFFYVPCTEMSPALLKPGSIITLFAQFPGFIFAYACQQNIFSISNEMPNVSVKKLTAISTAAVCTGFAIYLPLMLFPFMTFGYAIESSYLYNLDSNDTPVVIAFILASLSVSISYVLLLHPVRSSVMSLVFGTKQPTGNKERTIRIALTIALVAASFGLATALGKNVGITIGIAGLLGGDTMCFVMPFSLYLKRFGLNMKSPFSVAVAVSLVFSFLLYPICLTGIIYKQVNP